MFKVSSSKTTKKCEICSKLTIKTPKKHQWRSLRVSLVNFEPILHVSLVFLLLILNRWISACLLLNLVLLVHTKPYRGLQTQHVISTTQNKLQRHIWDSKNNCYLYRICNFTFTKPYVFSVKTFALHITFC